MGGQGTADSTVPPEATKVSRWWQLKGSTVIEDMKKVRVLHEQLNQTIDSLQEHLAELQCLVTTEENHADKEDS